MKYIYILKNKTTRQKKFRLSRFVYFYIKIGFSGNVNKRYKSIRNTLPQKERHKLVLCDKYRLFGAYHIEQFIHSKLKHYQKTFKGSGKTEYFLIPFTYFILLKFFLRTLTLLIGNYAYITLIIILLTLKYT